MQTSAGVSIDLQQHSVAERTTSTIAALVLTLGIASVAADCLNVKQPTFFNLHLLFGVSLWLSIGRCLLRYRAKLDFDSAVRYHEYSRRLSRWVYILLYLLAAVRLAFHLGEIMNPSAIAHGAPQAPRSLDDFQIYIAYALVPLWTMRFLLLRAPRRMGTLRSPSL